MSGSVAVGALVSPIGLVGAGTVAVTDDSSTDTAGDAPVEGSADDTTDETTDAPGHHHQRRDRARLTELSDIRGLSVDAIRSGLADGRTIAELAAGNGVDAELKAEIADRVSEMITTPPGDLLGRHHPGPQRGCPTLLADATTPCGGLPIQPHGW